VYLLWKGVVIRSQPYQLETREWMPEARLCTRTESGWIEQQVLGRRPCPSEDLARQASIQLGIDAIG